MNTFVTRGFGGLLLLCGANLSHADSETIALAQLPTTTTIPAQALVRSIFDRLDCDLDGTIEVDEVDEHFAQIWLPADQDTSRALSKKEFQTLHGNMRADQAESLFKEADADGDQWVNASELRRNLRQLVALADGNGDHEVSREEVGLQPHPVALNRAAAKHGH